MFSFSDNILNLTITELQYADEGLYVVRVENQAGVDFAVATLDVQG